MKNFNRLLHSVYLSAVGKIFLQQLFATIQQSTCLKSTNKEVFEQISGYKSITMQREGLHV